MELWVLIVSAYFAAGLVFVFVGPAARQRHIETEILELQLYNQPRWKLKAFSTAIALGIILLWPVLVPSAAKKDSAPAIDFPKLPEVPASPKMEITLLEILDRYSGSVPFEDYSAALKELPWSDKTHFNNELENRGYVITGFARGPDDQAMAVAISVLEIGIPIELTRMLGTVGTVSSSRTPAANEISIDPLDTETFFRTTQKPDDEVWDFTSSEDSWGHLAGRAGLALVRRGTVIETYITIMN